MPLSLDAIRNFGGNDSFLVDARTGNVQAENKLQRFKSFFNVGDARQKNAETIVMIHNAILNDPRFFAKDVRDAATALLSQVRTDRAIGVAQIKGILASLDAMSTPVARLSAARDLVSARIAARGLPAFLPASAAEDYAELARRNVPPDPEPAGGYGRGDYAAALDAFDAELGALFARLGDGDGDADVFGSVLYKALKDKDAAACNRLVDGFRANLDESRALGAEYGERTRLDVVEMLRGKEKPIQPTAAVPNPIRTVVETGRSIPTDALRRLGAQSSASEIDAALRAFSDALANAQLGIATVDGGERAATRELMTLAAANALPDDAKANLLAALESDAGKNLLAFYAEEIPDRDATMAFETANTVVGRLKAALGRPDADAPIPLPPSADPARLDSSILSRFSFSPERFASGDAAGPFRNCLQDVGRSGGPDPLAAYRARSSALASAKTALGICAQIVKSVAVERDEGGREISRSLDTLHCPDFDKDVGRHIDIRFPDGTSLDRTATAEQCRDKILRFVTGNPSAAYAGATRPERVKAMILMAVLNQASSGIAMDAFLETIAGDRKSAGSKILGLSANLDIPRSEFHTLSRDANGDITVKLHMRRHVNVALEGTTTIIPLAPESYEETDMEIRFPAGHLDDLSKRDWETLDIDAAMAADSNQAAHPDSLVAAGLVDPDFRFAGTVSVSAHYHLVKA